MILTSQFAGHSFELNYPTIADHSHTSFSTPLYNFYLIKLHKKTTKIHLYRINSKSCVPLCDLRITLCRVPPPSQSVPGSTNYLEKKSIKYFIFIFSFFNTMGSLGFEFIRLLFFKKLFNSFIPNLFGSWFDLSSSKHLLSIIH